MNEMMMLAVWLVGLAVVAFSVPAKALDPRTTKLAWPITGRRLRTVLGPVPVGLAEAAVLVLALVPAFPRLRFAVLGLLYAGYAVASAAMRGRPCACFGRTLVTRFGWGHAGACAILAFALLAAALRTPPTVTATSLVALVAVAGGAGASMILWRRRQHAGQRATDPARIPHIQHIVVYGSTGCPGCRGVWAQREQLAAIAARPVEFRLLEEGQSVEQAGGAIPAAIGYDRDGAAVYGPVVGLTAIRGLLTATARTGGGAPDEPPAAVRTASVEPTDAHSPRRHDPTLLRS
ncbi:hypothetical protein [Plantactinospora sonchi]|uniref:Methylamine utilization protein MauE n=1 Tax=Plantactinospora sonchi TaxID=1544735 RepID=A0ABU7RZG0_9ACTN